MVSFLIFSLGLMSECFFFVYFFLRVADVIW